MFGQRSTLVIAFDGLIADTLPVRLTAVNQGLAAAQLPAVSSSDTDLIAGRTLAEAIRHCVSRSAIPADETAIDLATLAAESAYSSLHRQAGVLIPEALDWFTRASAHYRLVVRSDGLRSYAERIVETAGLTSMIAFLRCSDDGSLQPGQPSSFAQSYSAISERVSAFTATGSTLKALECASEELYAQANGVLIKRVQSLLEYPTRPYGSL